MSVSLTASMDNLLRQPVEWPEHDGGLADIVNFPSPGSYAMPAQDMEPLRLCSACGNIVPFAYFRVRGLVACESCAIRVLIGRPAGSDAAFASALFFGVCGAVFSLILCAVFSAFTHVDSVYLACLVGWIVGRAMKHGSFGLGGRRFQIAAASLTFVGVSLSESLSGIIKVSVGNLLSPQSGLAPVSELAFRIPIRLGPDPLIASLHLMGLLGGLCIAWRLTTRERIPVDGPFGVTPR